MIILVAGDAASGKSTSIIGKEGSIVGLSEIPNDIAYITMNKNMEPATIKFAKKVYGARFQVFSLEWTNKEEVFSELLKKITAAAKASSIIVLDDVFWWIKNSVSSLAPTGKGSKDNRQNIFDGQSMWLAIFNVLRSMNKTFIVTMHAAYDMEEGKQVLNSPGNAMKLMGGVASFANVVVNTEVVVTNKFDASVGGIVRQEERLYRIKPSDKMTFVRGFSSQESDTIKADINELFKTLLK